MEEAVIEASLSDEHSLEQFSHLLSKDEIKYYSKIDDWKFPAAVLVEIATIAAAIWVSETFWNPFIYLLAVIVIGSRMHAFGVLMHDAAHYRAFSNRKWNDLAGEIIALVLPTSMQGYRNNHFPHHHDLNTDKDPDWLRFIVNRRSEYSFPKKKSELLLLLLQYAVGLKTLKEMEALREEQFKRIPSRLKWARRIFYTVLIMLAIALGFWKGLILYGLIPSLTIFIFTLYVVAVSEHYTNLELQHVLNKTRTVIAPFWERWLLAPYGINYHIEHHLYPSVPFYRLSELHHYLMTKPVFADAAHITYGYSTGLFRESCAAA